MNDYRDAYENYYRNLNKPSHVVEKRLSRNYNKSINIRRQADKGEINIQKIFINHVCGACIILASYTLLKYIPLDNCQYIYKKSREVINSNVTYDGTIEAVKKINIGKYSMADANIKGFTLDDLKEKALKEKLSKCFEYIEDQGYDKEKQI